MTTSLGQPHVQCGHDKWLSSVHKGREILSCNPWEHILWPLSGQSGFQQGEGWMHWAMVGFLIALLRPHLLVSSVGAAPQPSPAQKEPRGFGGKSCLHGHPSLCYLLRVTKYCPVRSVLGLAAVPWGSWGLPSAAAAPTQALSGLCPTPALPAPSPAGGPDWPGGVEPQGQDHSQPQPRGDPGQLPALAGVGAAAEEAP